MMTDVPTMFALLGGIIFVGFFGVLLFEKTRIPDVLLIIFLGVLIGPVYFGLTGSELMPKQQLSDIAPYFAALALIIILFDGGLGLDLDRVIRYFGITAVHSVLGFLISVLSVAPIGVIFFDMPVGTALLLGSIIGGTTSAIVLPIISRMNVDEETRIILILESVITDVLCVIVSLSIIDILVTKSSDYSIAFKGLASGFSIAIVIALIFGLFWLWVLRYFEGKPYEFMITIAALFVLYACVEQLGGSGPLSSLIFGMVLSNSKFVTGMFKIRTKFVLDQRIKQFHSEISFLVRTFFFVYLGVLIGISDVDLLFVAGAVAIIVAILLGRHVVTGVTVRLHPERTAERDLLWLMMPRGLAAAVLASYPMAEGIQGSERFVDLAFIVIVATVIISTIGAFRFERRRISKTSIEKGDKEGRGEKTKGAGDGAVSNTEKGGRRKRGRGESKRG